MLQLEKFSIFLNFLESFVKFSMTSPQNFYEFRSKILQNLNRNYCILIFLNVFSKVPKFFFNFFKIRHNFFQHFHKFCSKFPKQFHKNFWIRLQIFLKIFLFFAEIRHHEISSNFFKIERICL